MARYKTKSVEIQAVKFTRHNIEEVKEFTNGKAKISSAHGEIYCRLECNNGFFGVMENKYIVKVSDDIFYICSEDSFEEAFESLD